MFRKLKKLEDELAVANQQIKELKDEQIQSGRLNIRDGLGKLVRDRLNNNQLLKEVQDQINELAGRQDKVEVLLPLKEASDRIAYYFEDNSWNNLFEANFEKVYGNFLTRLKVGYPELTLKDCRLCQFIVMGLSTKELSFLTNRSVRGVEVSRYRLRKKLSLDADTSLSSFLATMAKSS